MRIKSQKGISLGYVGKTMLKSKLRQQDCSSNLLNEP